MLLPTGGKRFAERFAGARDRNLSHAVRRADYFGPKNYIAIAFNHKCTIARAQDAIERLLDVRTIGTNFRSVMQTIQPIQTEHAAGSTKRLLETVKVEGGAIDNMIKTMAQSPNALEGYLQFRHALVSGRLSAKIRERIALTVAQANLCEYSLLQHTALGRQNGLTDSEILESREARASDEQVDVVLKFAHNLATRSGEYSPEEMSHAGYSDSEIVEIVADVALNLFANYFNLAAKTEIDLTVKAKAA